jgi:hypothetical protein
MMIVTQLEGTAYKQAHPNFEKTDCMNAWLLIHTSSHSQTISTPQPPPSTTHRTSQTAFLALAPQCRLRMPLSFP